jgi:hypothetical protein
MKALRIFILCLGVTILFSSCSAWNNLFGPKYGCKTNGKNVGAEKLANGDPAAAKAAKKAKKFKA